ncbi:uncharacterized protein LOC111204050 [Brassica napus]|uniref:uncharacterized protein LOC111204050 n=1 Tax=Brassica napus TaxID=3708 RepID=UPI0020798AAD|nr:uncharacterized protein LOC111204050 [Brassica napus]
MDILSKLLDKGAMDNQFGLHPQGNAPLITHISFADDVLLFFDGTDQSLQGLLSILEDFNKCSGLGINKSKCAVFFDGGDSGRSRASARVHGISQGSFPIRYLGVPLTTKKLRRQDYQPLIDKLHLRFSSWTVRHLSFAGRLQLLKSVIYSTISFWASIFLLPIGCLKTLEQMCNSFLWKGVPTGARGEKVSWDVVCSSKESGGLGSRRLCPWNNIMGLKLIWLLFASSGSLWVSWTRLHRIGSDNFWVLDANRRGSWIWKSLCELRTLARPFVLCEISSGLSGSFWFDNWTSLGPLIELLSVNAPRITGLAETTTVREALMGNQWWLSSSRSRNPIISFLRDSLPDPVDIFNSEVDDRYLWQIGGNTPRDSFSSSAMWNYLYNQSPAVPWYRSVWFARITGLAETATVREALMGNQWWLSSSRSRNPIISFLRDSLPDPVDIFNSEVDDRYLWQIGGNTPRDGFSSSAMWNYLYNQSPAVPWYRSVWFAGMIPKHGFIMWLAALDRLSTRDRMRRWGVSVSPLCLFCGSSDECRQHIFFDCPYCREVWSFFYSRLHLSPPPLFEEGLRWVRSPTHRYGRTQVGQKSLDKESNFGCRIKLLSI